MVEKKTSRKTKRHYAIEFSIVELKRKPGGGQISETSCRYCILDPGDPSSEALGEVLEALKAGRAKK